MRKLSLTVARLDSVLVSCMTMEQYSRKATNKFDGAPDEFTLEEAIDSPEFKLADDKLVDMLPLVLVEGVGSVW